MPSVKQAVIHTQAGTAKILEKMRGLSRQGKLPGFEAKGEEFVALAYGWVYDFDFIAKPTAGAGGTVLRFDLQVKRKTPWIVAAMLALSIFPGVWITHSMLAIYFGWYPAELWKTCVWYLPLSIIPIPWVWKTAMERSRTAAEESSRELLERIATELNGKIEYSAAPSV